MTAGERVVFATCFILSTGSHLLEARRISYEYSKTDKLARKANGHFDMHSVTFKVQRPCSDDRRTLLAFKLFGAKAKTSFLYSFPG